MKGSGIGTLILLLLLLFGCQPLPEEYLIPHSASNMARDTFPGHFIKAGYVEGENVILFLSHKQNDTVIIKADFYNGFPIIRDSLKKINDSCWQSKTFQTVYAIHSKEIEVIHPQKIIHPSSNWQGQTPWKEIQRFVYERAEVKKN